MSAPQPEPDVPREGVGPSLMLLPLLALLCWVLWLRRGPSLPGAGRAAPPSAAEQQTQGWLGELELGDGARLEARLVTLHGEQGRQEFDRSVLAQRLGLDPGEPWLLELAYRPGTAQEPPSLALGDLMVLCDGAQLVPLVRLAPVPTTEGVVDPLLSLLALPTALPSGSAVNAVLWGLRPGSSATLNLGGHQVHMGAGVLPAGSISRTLAHLKRSAQR